MAHVSDSLRDGWQQPALSELKYDDMAASDILKEMKKMMAVLEKKTKKTETALTKVEEKKVKSAPVKGVRPAQFDQNAEWVNFVLAHILAEGWESFIHAERCGKVMADVEYPASELAEVEMDGETIQIHIFAGSDNEQPNLSHAMTLSKLYRSEKADLYEAFLSQYVAPTPVEGAGRVVKPAVQRVSMTLEERRAEQARKEAEKEAEKERKKAEREAERERKKAEKEEEKRFAKEMREAAKAVKAPPKAAVKRALVPVAGVKSVLAAKTIAKPVAKPVAAWVQPEKGQSNEWTEPKSSVTYLRDHLDRLFTMDAQGEAHECVGWWNGSAISTEDVPKAEE